MFVTRAKTGNDNMGSLMNRRLTDGPASVNLTVNMTEFTPKERLIEQGKSNVKPCTSTELQSCSESSSSIPNFQDASCFRPLAPSSPTFFQMPSQALLNSPKQRLVSKRGNLRVVSKNVPNKAKLYASDLFTTVIDLRWHWVLLFFVLSYIVSWLLFALIWWAIVRVRGVDVCFDNVNNWTSAFLFSVETQQTIGYGGRSVTTKCPEAAIVLQFQTLVGIVIDAFLLGLTFAKISRPRERSKTVLFSEHAVITLRDGKMCLVFRVGDVRKSQLVEAHIRLQLFRSIVTAEGHEFPFYQQNLRVCYDWRNYEDDDDRHQLFLLFPQDVVHVIDEKSPFFDVTQERLQQSNFELVFILDAIVEATGMNTQVKGSCLSDEILWGYDFKNVSDRAQVEGGNYWADFSQFNELYEVDTPTCSPREYYEQQGALLRNGAKVENFI